MVRHCGCCRSLGAANCVIDLPLPANDENRLHGFTAHCQGGHRSLCGTCVANDSFIVISIGIRKLSDGRKLSVVDWRTNRLVDILAKLSASEAHAPMPVIALLESATEATLHAACLLGMVTHAANNHEVTTFDDGGKEVTRTLRDAVQAERTYKRKHVASSEQPVSANACGDTVHVKPWTEDCDGRCVKSHRSMTALASGRITDASHLKRRVEEIGTSLRVPPERETAAVRLERLRQRIRTREAAAGAGKC